MNVLKYSCAIVFSLVALYACNNDDDRSGAIAVPPRDRGEQQVTDDAQLQEYLKTHFYSPVDVDLNGDGVIDYQTATLDSLTATDGSQVSLMDSGLLTTKEITREDVKYNLYILNLAQGEVAERKPTFADSTLVTYRGELLYENEDKIKIFDSSVTPVWFDLVNNLVGFRESLLDFGIASSIEENTDGTFTASGFGHLIVFMPSGLAYFNSPPDRSIISPYDPLIFNVQLYSVNEADHDRDGIPSYLEDLDEDGIVSDLGDDTDEDLNPNYSDADDDNDGTLTRDEITLVAGAKDDGIVTLGEIIFYDDDKDGILNHLDPDDRDSKNE